MFIYNSSLSNLARTAFVIAIYTATASNAAYAQNDDIAQPPTVERTAGSSVQAASQTTSATQSTPETLQESQKPKEEAATNTGANRLFGKTKITERKHENGLVYSIELEHSSGAKQYIEDNDADGLNDTSTNNIDDNPSIAKWRLGSW